MLQGEKYHDLKDFYYTFMELPKFTQGVDALSSMVDRWAYFFKHASEIHERNLDKLVGDDVVILGLILLFLVDNSTQQSIPQVSLQM